MRVSMPSPIGHALAGVAVSLVAGRSVGRAGFLSVLTRPLTLVAVAVATLPDIDLLLRGFHRTATHSLSATVLVTIVAIVVTGRVTFKSPVGSQQSAVASRAAWVGTPWLVAIVCAAAHASHL